MHRFGGIRLKINNNGIWFFLLGLGAQTQVHFFGSIGISELVVFLIAPWILVLDYASLKRDGFHIFVHIGILTCIGCVISGITNHTHPLLFLKGLALPYGILSAVVVFHRLFRKDRVNLKWYFVGSFLSGIVSIFIFQPETFTVREGAVATGSEAIEAVTSYSLFWSEKIGSLIRLPVCGWYLQTPLSYSLFAILGLAVFTIISSNASGRAAALVAVISFAFIAFGGKSRKRIQAIGKHFGVVCISFVILLVVFKLSYQYAAENGYLGVKARDKYEKQTAMGKSALRLLIAGRTEFFASLRACLDKPIIGFGPRPIDSKGYYREFLKEYGNPDDYDQYVRWEFENARRGFTIGELMRTHSHITSFWAYYGIMGLIFWLYVLWLLYKYVKVFACAYPRWYGYLAMSVASMMWSIFFNPLSSRIGEGLMISSILMVRAIYMNSIILNPMEIAEIEKYNK